MIARAPCTWDAARKNQNQNNLPFVVSILYHDVQDNALH